jgi:MraZ protein
LAVGLLLGTLELTDVDAPLQLPDRFLPAFASGGVLSAWLDGCLALWPQASWAELANRMVALPMSMPGSRTFSRLLFSSALEFGFDRAGVVVPGAHRSLAGIEDRAILVGAGDHAELWSPGRWAEAAARRLEDLELPASV